jgi:hypothetical protein
MRAGYTRLAMRLLAVALLLVATRGELGMPLARFTPHRDLKGSLAFCLKDPTYL